MAHKYSKFKNKNIPYAKVGRRVFNSLFDAETFCTEHGLDVNLAIAVLFGKKYLGKVPNDAAGRISLWNDIVKHHTELQDIRAIENFSGENVTVEKGDTKKSVVVTDYVTPVNAMEQLYMTVYVQ